MSLIVLHKSKMCQYVLVPFKRPKGEVLHYGSGPIETVGEKDIDDYLLTRLEADRIETREGVPRELMPPFPLTVQEEKKLLTGAKAIRIYLKRIDGGHLDVFRFSPCEIVQRRMHRILDIDPDLNIEVEFPGKKEKLITAFHSAFEKAS